LERINQFERKGRVGSAAAVHGSDCFCYKKTNIHLENISLIVVCRAKMLMIATTAIIIIIMLR
jgi:hypothetical protein